MLPNQEILISPEDLPSPRRSRERTNATERMETRRQMHLSCEHRRRHAIQSGISRLRELLEEDNPMAAMPVNLPRKTSTSRADVMIASIRKINELHRSLEKLEREQERLMKENAHLKRVSMLPTYRRDQESVWTDNSQRADQSELTDGNVCPILPTFLSRH